MSARELFNHQIMKKNMKVQQCLKSVGGLALSTLLMSQAWAVSVINAITSGEQAGEIIVQVEMSEPLRGVPEGFVIQDPARIAIDLPSVKNGMDKSQLSLSQGNLRSINVVEAGDRTRLVLNLGNPAQYTTQVDGNTLLIKLSPDQLAASRNASATSATTSRDLMQQSNTQVAAVGKDLQNIDFRPSADGAGALIITLPSDQTAVNINSQGDKVVLDILQTTLPSALRKRLDVKDYQTPMQFITPEQVGQNVRVTVQAKGYWDKSAYQAQNQYVLELHPVADDDPKKLSPGSGYKGELLSLSFKDVEVQVLLQSIASFTGLNVITSDAVTGTLTLHLTDVPWDQALDIIMQARGLAADRNGNVLWIAPRAEIDRIQQERVRSIIDEESYAPLRTQVFQLNYAKADTIVASMNNSGTNGVKSQSLLSDRGSVIVDPRTNKLIVTDTPTKLENLAGVIAQIDIPVRQVMIEARIVEARDGWGRNLGTRLSGNLWGNSNGHGYGIAGTMPAEDDGGGDDDGNSGTVKNDIYNFFNLAAQPSSGQAGYFAFQFKRNATQYLQLELQALQTENYGRNIASPSLTTQDSVTASVEQGFEIPYQESTSSGATSITFRKAVLGLEVTPTITPDGNVQLKIQVAQDSPDAVLLGATSIKTNRVNTQVTVENGGTIVIGGIFKEQEYTETSKIPLLGDIPLLGTFFRNSNKTHERTELLVFITPRIIDDGFIRSGMAVPNLAR